MVVDEEIAARFVVASSTYTLGVRTGMVPAGGRWRLRDQHHAALGGAYGEERAGAPDPRDRAGAADADL